MKKVGISAFAVMAILSVACGQSTCAEGPGEIYSFYAAATSATCAPAAPPEIGGYPPSALPSGACGPNSQTCSLTVVEQCICAGYVGRTELYDCSCEDAGWQCASVSADDAACPIGCPPHRDDAGSEEVD
jgi:hypothetical protein